MNGSRSANAVLLEALKSGPALTAQVVVCAPAVYVGDVAQALQGTTIAWGAQDCSAFEPGPHTGDIAASMLADLGCRYVINGHSERRTHHAETDQQVADKAKAALAHDVTPIVCVGETWEDRQAGLTDVVVKRQLSAVVHALGHCISQIVVAYEPLWAIGSGRTATPEQAQAVHAVLRSQLRAATPHAAQMRILYGGSVNAANAASLFAQPDIDGGLIGGASLKAADFAAICLACA